MINNFLSISGGKNVRFL